MRQRGGGLPAGTIPLEEARALPGLRGKSHMTARRALEPARVGEWLPESARHWIILYDAAKVARIVHAIEHPPVVAWHPRETRFSKLPFGPREGWATADMIKLALRHHGIDGTYFTARWIRERLLELGVPSEVRVVTRAAQRVFPVDRAIGELKSDPRVLRRIG